MGNGGKLFITQAAQVVGVNGCKVHYFTVSAKASMVTGRFTRFLRLISLLNSQGQLIHGFLLLMGHNVGGAGPGSARTSL